MGESSTASEAVAGLCSTEASRKESTISIQDVVGIIVILVGLALIGLHRVVPKMIHAGLRIFLGEPVADDAVRPGSSSIHVLIVGVGFVAFGAFMVVSEMG